MTVQEQLHWATSPPSGFLEDYLTLPVPPSPTKTSLKVAAAVAASAMVEAALSWVLGYLKSDLLTDR